MMGDSIRISRTTAMLVAGFMLAIVIGGYAVAAAPVQKQAPAAAGNTAAALPGGSQTAAQDVYLTATSSGYDRSQITVRKGIPVRLHFTAINAGCGSYLVIYGMGVNVLSKNNAEAVVEFTPQAEGTFEYNCGMRMFPPGRFVVTA
jgi:hypothetical protein